LADFCTAEFLNKLEKLEMNIKIKRIDNAFKLEAINERGNVVHTDANPEIGGSNSAFRPMEMLLVSLAGCSAIDVINILNRQKQTITDFQMEIIGDRTGGIPSPFNKIDIHFTLTGDIKSNKLEKALQLTQEKYCSVLHSLKSDIDINYHYKLN
jgi:putative redox protein